VVCDLTIASEEHAKFLQTDPDVASFDGGFGSAYLARQIGQKRAREVFFLGETYDAAEAVDLGMADAAVAHAELESVALDWAERINRKSPTAIRMLKYAFNLADDGLVGQQVFAGFIGRPMGLKLGLRFGLVVVCKYVSGLVEKVGLGSSYARRRPVLVLVFPRGGRGPRCPGRRLLWGIESARRTGA
jgi:hypothetical protein